MLTSSSWRDDALNDALLGESESESADRLLRAIRQHTPQAATLVMEANRHQLHMFFATHTTDYVPLTQGTQLCHERDALVPYLGWYGAQWQPDPDTPPQMIELVLTPTGNPDGLVILSALAAAALHAFAAALQVFVIRPQGRTLRYSANWKSAPDMDAELGKVTWDDLVLPPAMLAGLREAVEGFVTQRAAFGALGFAWRRGILLVGPPGTGKTMVCKAAAAALPDLPFLYVRDFREYREREAIRTIFDRARKLAPCILSFEDIDGLVGNEYRTVFLNELDGFENNEGLLIIASSNHPERIDEALLKRPSRFDRVFHLGIPKITERREFCLRVLRRPSFAERIAPTVDTAALAQQVAQKSDGFTPAYLKEVFLAAALHLAQQGITTLDERWAAAVLAQVNELRNYLRRSRDPEALADMSNRGEMPMGFRHHEPWE